MDSAQQQGDPGTQGHAEEDGDPPRVTDDAGQARRVPGSELALEPLLGYVDRQAARSLRRPTSSGMARPPATRGQHAARAAGQLRDTRARPRAAARRASPPRSGRRGPPPGASHSRAPRTRAGSAAGHPARPPQATHEPQRREATPHRSEYLEESEAYSGPGAAARGAHARSARSRAGAGSLHAALADVGEPSFAEVGNGVNREP